MPSVITHDTFGRELYAPLNETIGQSEDEKQAFLLGCQGPDPLFYGAINPLTPSANGFAKRQHRYHCTEFLTALALGVPRLHENNTYPDCEEKFLQAKAATPRQIARAYAIGYLMHFELDSKVHPFVFSQQFAYCSAGVPDLTLADQREVHVEIESELDELVLYLKRGQSISTFNPSLETLTCKSRSINIIEKLIEFAQVSTFQAKPQPGSFKYSVKVYRQVLSWLYSATGVKREFLGRFERLFRKYSYLEAMIYNNKKITESIFDNHERATWQDPWIEGKTHDESFWDLYDSAIVDGARHILSYAKIIDELCENLEGNRREQGCQTCVYNPTKAAKDEVRNVFSKVWEITQNVNFYGCPESLADPKTGRTPAKSFSKK